MSQDHDRATSGPWVTFYPSDWLAGTRGLTAAETGVYITLIAMMYERGEALKMDHARLARLCGLPKASFLRALDVLIGDGKIVETDSGLWNNRVSDVLNQRQNMRDTRSKAAKTRWRKTQQNQQAEDASAMQVQCKTDANHNHNHKEKETPNGVSKKKRGSRLPDDWVLPPDWGAWAISEGYSEPVIRLEAEKFRDHWHSTPGQRGVKLDWQATWRNWIRNSRTGAKNAKPKPFGDHVRELAAKLDSGEVRWDRSSRDPFAALGKPDDDEDQSGSRAFLRSVS